MLFVTHPTAPPAKCQEEVIGQEKSTETQGHHNWSNCTDPVYKLFHNINFKLFLGMYLGRKKFKNWQFTYDNYQVRQNLTNLQNILFTQKILPDSVDLSAEVFYDSGTPAILRGSLNHSRISKWSLLPCQDRFLYLYLCHYWHSYFCQKLYLSFVGRFSMVFLSVHSKFCTCICYFVSICRIPQWPSDWHQSNVKRYLYVCLWLYFVFISWCICVGPHICIC